MKPLVTFADPERTQIDYLTAELAGRPEAYMPPTITPSFPAGPLAGDATHVQVELEAGGVQHYPITERAQVRFTCYAAPGKRTTAKALAALVMAYVYAQPGDGDVAGARILVGRSDVITDPDTRNLMVWFLAEIPLLATPVAS